MSRRWSVIPVILVACAGLGFACAASPRQRPLQTSPISDSLQLVRKQLEGTWDLVTLEIHPPAGEAVRVRARGVLIYDAYGNLEINGTITEAADAKMAAAEVLNVKGRAVIDVANQQIQLRAVEGNVTDLSPELSHDRIRRYEFDGNLLRLTSLDADGRIAAVVAWKKR